MIRYTCELNKPYESFSEEFEDEYDFINFLRDNFENELMCFSNFKYDPGVFCDIDSDTVESDMLDYCKAYLYGAFGDTKVFIEVLDSEKSSSYSKLFVDFLYEEINRNANEEESFQPTKRRIQCDAVEIFADNSSWHCDFLDGTDLVDEDYVEKITPIKSNGKLSWLLDGEEVEPIIWFGQEFDYDQCADYWILTRDNSCWGAADGECFSSDFADVDDYGYDSFEYGTDMPSIGTYAEDCPIEMDECGNYDPQDIDKYFINRIRA